MNSRIKKPCPLCGDLYYPLGIMSHRGSKRCEINRLRKFGNPHTTVAGNQGGLLTMVQLQAAVDMIRARYPASRQISELRVLDHKYLRKHFPEAPQKISNLFGIPIYTDETVPPNKVKLIFADGTEKTYDVHA